MTRKKNENSLIVATDLGSTSVRMAVGQLLRTGQRDGLHILGAAEIPSGGIHKGTITSIEDAVSSVSSLIDKMERSIGSPIEHTWVGVGGHAILADVSKGVVAVARPTGEVTGEDVERVLEAARTVVTPLNYEILHVIPRYFRVDGGNAVKDPVGMSGVRLEADALIIQAAAAHIRNVTRVIYRTSLNINDLVLSMLASSDVVTTERGRDMGVAVVDIGSALTSLVVIEGGDIIHVASIPIGSDHISADLSIGLRISIEMAEKLKINEGTASLKGLTKRDEIDLSLLGEAGAECVQKKFVAEIIEARVEELFDKIDDELKTVGRSGVLPAGVMCIGGGAKLQGILEVAKRRLRLPVAHGYPIGITSVTDIINDIAFSNVISLVKWGADICQSDTKSGWNSLSLKFKTGETVVSSVKKWMRSLLP